MTGQRKPGRNAPIKVIQSATRVRLRDSLSESAHVSIYLHVMYFFFFPLNTSLFHARLSVFVRILFCKARGPGPLSLTTGLVPRIWYFHRSDPAGNPSSAPRHRRPRPPESPCRPALATDSSALAPGRAQPPALLRAWLRSFFKTLSGAR